MPVRTSTQRDYGRRIARAMAHIAENLDRAPGLDELAGVAAFSPFHFHRVYRALAGETPAETLLRARMSRAAVELLRGELPLARVGRRAGYGSAAAFSRAFRAAYGVPPGAYRARGGLVGTFGPGDKRKERIAMFEVTLREEPAMTLAVIRHAGPYDGIGLVYDRLMAWAGPRGLVGPEGRFIAVYLDDPESVPAAALRSEAGLVVPPGTAVEGEVLLRDIPATRVAVVRWEGPYAELEPVYTWLYRDWLPASGEEPSALPAMEDYLNDPRSLPPAEWLTDVMIPLKG